MNIQGLRLLLWVWFWGFFLKAECLFKFWASWSYHPTTSCDSTRQQVIHYCLKWSRDFYSCTAVPVLTPSMNRPFPLAATEQKRHPPLTVHAMPCSELPLPQICWLVQSSYPSFSHFYQNALGSATQSKLQIFASLIWEVETSWRICYS